MRRAEAYSNLRSLFDWLNQAGLSLDPHCSMGMTAGLETAVERGAAPVRAAARFSPRPQC